MDNEINEKIYKHGYIYKYFEPESKLFYIGSTKDFYKRKIIYKSNFNNENSSDYNKKFYRELRKINKSITDCEFIILLEFKNILKKELLKKEDEIIDFYIHDVLCCNENKSYTSLNKKEYIKEYREKNKKELLDKNKEYREKNKKEISEYKKEYYEKNKDKISEKYICSICQGNYTYSNKSAHLKTQIHLKALDNNN